MCWGFESLRDYHLAPVAQKDGAPENAEDRAWRTGTRGPATAKADGAERELGDRRRVPGVGSGNRSTTVGASAPCGRFGVADAPDRVREGSVGKRVSERPRARVVRVRVPPGVLRYVAQSAEASGLNPEPCGFESRRTDRFILGLGHRRDHAPCGLRSWSPCVRPMIDSPPVPSRWLKPARRIQSEVRRQEPGCRGFDSLHGFAPCSSVVER